MKIELKKETNRDAAPWYAIYMDGEYVYGEWYEDKARNMFDMLKEDPTLLKKREEILDSYEIVVPLSEEK